MNRFRRKSDAASRKRRDDAAPSSPPSAPSSSAPMLNLPEASAFRTSLILPHLTRRFALLRGEDGKLVSLDQMESHLAAQRQTGKLTAYEVDAVLAQYHLQSMDETQAPPPRAALAGLQDSRLRSGWAASKDLLYEDDERNSFMSYSSDRPSSSTMGQSHSFPFPYLLDQPSLVALSTESHVSSSVSQASATIPPSPKTFKRGGSGNSMFAGRSGPSVAQLKMSKSSSSTSLKSIASSKHPKASTDDDTADTDASAATAETAADEETKETEGASQSEVDLDLHWATLPELTPKQINRISRVLDDIASELHLTLLDPPKEEEEENDTKEELTDSTTGSIDPSLSPVNDTERVDPYFQRLPTVSLNALRRPSTVNSFIPSLAPSSGRSTPLLSDPFTSRTNGPSPTAACSVSRRPSAASVAPSASERGGTTPTPPADAFFPDISNQQYDLLSDRPPSAASSSGPFSDPFANNRSRQLSSSPSSDGPFSTVSGAFPSVPDRRESRDAFQVDDGPFDLNYSSSRGSGLSRAGSKSALSRSNSKVAASKKRRHYAATSASTDPSSTMFSPALNGSTSSLGSVGSSYHAEMFDDEEQELEEEVLPEDDESEASPVDPHATSSSTLVPPPTPATERRTSADLLKEIITESGDADLALEDLVMIQETLVRSASRRAAYKLAGASPSNFSASSDGRLSRSRSRASGTESRKRSFVSVGEDAVDRAAPPAFKRGSVCSDRSTTLSFVTSSQMTPGTSMDSYGAENVKVSPANPPVPSTMPFDAIDHGKFVGATVSDASDDEKEHLRDPSNVKDSATLGAPVELEPPTVPRVPRTLAPRNPAATQSVLIRDVRDQANLATMALKKGSRSPQSPKVGTARYKSIRNASISQPHLVSGPVGMSTVPIITPSPAVDVSLNESHSRKGGKNGIGIRFKMLLKKHSRDHLVLNGDEVTPFVDFEASPENAASPPFTPPSQHASQFAVSPQDYPRTPEYPETPDANRPSAGLHRSPGLLAVEEVWEAPSSPAVSTSTSTGSKSGSIRSLVSRFRRPRQGSDAASRASTTTSPLAPTSPGSPYSPAVSRQPSIQHVSPTQPTTVGLGFPVDTGRAPISYDINGSRRARHSYHDQETAPLNLVATQPLDLSQATRPVATVISTAPPLNGTEGRHSATPSIDSMKKLWEAAEDLGLPPDKVQELVELSYAQSPTSSTGHRPSASTGSASTIDGDRRSTRQRLRSSSVASVPRGNGHTRGGSESSVKSKSSGIRRGNSTAGAGAGPRPRSFHDRAPTPPPSAAHRRKVSQSTLASEPVPFLPKEKPEATHTASLSVDASDNRRQSRLSASTTGSLGSVLLRPPLSPSPSSYRSSGYAGSLFDMYGDDGEESPAEGKGVATARGSISVTEDGTGLPKTRDVENVPTVSTPEAEKSDGALVWRVVDNLKNHRVSTSSDGYSFHSRQSSIDSASASGQAPTLAQTSSDPFQLLVHDHRRQPNPDAQHRYPSVFFRDEKRLLHIAQTQNGISPTDDGAFLVRHPRSPPIDAIPELQEYERDLLLSYDHRAV